MSQEHEEISGYVDSLIRLLKGNNSDEFVPIITEINKIVNADLKQRKDLEFGDYWLNAVCVGFVRYFDESGVEWREYDNVRFLVQKLVKCAAQNLRLRTPVFSPQTCGRHEDGACVIEPLGSRIIVQKEEKHLDGDSLFLDVGDAACFATVPLPVILPKGTKIQRVIADPAKKFGVWWKVNHLLPLSKLAWRANYAVLEMWNANRLYVNAELKKDVPAWVGIAASQKVKWKDKNGNLIDEKCILRGGLIRIYIDTKFKSKLDLLLTEKTDW